MSVFADSSALVKIYADEPGADIATGLRDVVVSQLARVEVPAALWRKHRLGELGASDAQVLTAEFEADYFGTHQEPPRFIVVIANSAVLGQAARLVATRGLRAYDAVQLSSALAARSADAGCSEFAAFDQSLRDAAAAEGFSLTAR